MLPSIAQDGAVVACATAVEASPPTLQGVYAAHADFVWRVLRAHGVREGDLDDQTHEVFLVVHRKLGEFEGRAAITTWLFGIAARVASDYRRSARVRRERMTGVVPERASGLGGAPEAADARVERGQARVVLGHILDGMLDEQRVVFALFELDGMSGDQIAELVGCSVNTVYSRLRLARKYFDETVGRLRARGAL
jgi:RNA polymerase sigma-70 factor (ECF subfamily)